MEDIVIAAKVIHKHMTEAEWKNSNYIPAKGETIVYDGESGEKYKYARYKIGNGKNLAKDLPFASDSLYVNKQPMVQNVGGVLAENHPNGFDYVQITELLTELLYPYTAPSFISITCTPKNGNYQKNENLRFDTIKYKIATGSKKITQIKVKLKQGETEENIVEEINSDWSAIIEGTISINRTFEGTKTITVTISAFNDKGDSASQTMNYYFYPKYFYWIDGTENSSVQTAKGNLKIGTTSFTVTPNEQYIYVAFPKGEGQLAFNAGGFDGGFEEPYDTGVYSVYRSTNKISGNTTVTVK